MIRDNSELYDVIVQGLGIYGASVVYHAAQQGKTVLGLEKYQVVHDRSSSYGETRITRQNVFEGQVYPEIAKKSQSIISDIERETNQKLQFFRGGLYIGRPNSHIITNMLRNEERFGLKIQKLSAQQINERYPLRVSDEFMAVLDTESAGYCSNDIILRTMIDLAVKHRNAEVMENIEVLGYEQVDDIVVVQTTRGTFKTRKLIMTQGAGNIDMLRNLGAKIYAQRNQAAWLKWEIPDVKPDRLPIVYWDYNKQQQIYCFPNVGSGLKIGLHKRGQEVDTKDKLSYEYDTNLLEELKEVTTRTFQNIPWQAKDIDRVKPCYYTMTSDEDFIIDFHPNNKNVVMVSCCSGHGFKYAAQLGKDILRMTETNQIPYREFRLSRFQKTNRNQVYQQPQQIILKPKL